MKILCKIGWHRWVYNFENFNLLNGFGGRYTSEFKTRTCKNCCNKQYLRKLEWKNSN